MDTPKTTAEPPASDPTGSDPHDSNPPPPPNRPRPPKRLYRDPHGPLGGVASGLAGYFEIDPLIVRLLWIAALFSGIGLPSYLVCWLVIPKAKTWPPPDYQDRPASRALGSDNSLLIVGFAILFLAGIIGLGKHGIADYLLPAALIGFGVYLLNQRRSDLELSAEEPGPSPTAPETIEGAWLRSAQSGPERARTSGARVGRVGPFVLSLLAIGAGLAGVWHAAGISHVSLGAISAGALLVVGIGLLASLWLGRARGLIPLGLGLSLVMLVASPFENRPDGAPGYGRQFFADLRRDSGSKKHRTRTYKPRSMSELLPRYERPLGNLVVDLTQLKLAGETRKVEVHVGAGRALILVPKGMPVEVSGQVGLGEIKAWERKDQGISASLEESRNASGPGKWVIDLSVGLGQAEVRHES